jgi:NADH dehydrogenase
MDANGQPSQATPGTVIVVGGGFGGLYTALAIAQERHHPPVLLVEPREHFIFLPLLYELLSGELRSWEIAPRYDKVLAGHGVGWLQDRVERIDLATRTLQTAAGRSFHWERLVLATGASTDSFGVPGADRHTLSFRSLSDVQRLQQLLTQLAQAGRPLQRLAVVGGGPTGVELACKLADLAGATAVVELIEQGETLLPQSHAFNREQAGADPHPGGGGGHRPAGAAAAAGGRRGGAHGAGGGVDGGPALSPPPDHALPRDRPDRPSGLRPRAAPARP